MVLLLAFLVAVLWLLVMLVAVCLCVSAKAGDEAMTEREPAPVIALRTSAA
jgi:hypothetical protein